MPEKLETSLQPLLDEDEDFETGEVELPVGPTRRRRIWWLVVTLVVVLAVVGSGLLYWRLNQPAPVQYTQVAAQTGNISVKISATGPINPNAQYNLNFATTGQIHEIDVQSGQHVTQGQTLAKLTVDTTALQDAVTQAQLGVTSAQNDLSAAQTALTNAKTDETNQQAQNAAALTVAQDQEQNDITTCQTEKNPPANCQQVAQDKLAQTQSQLTASNTAAQEKVTSAQNQVTSAQNALDKANAQLQTAQDNLNNASANATLVSPANATVAAVNGTVGQNTGNAGTITGSSQPFIVLTDTSQLSIAAQVNEADIGNVQIGQPAQFTVAAYPNTTFRASVVAINTVGQTTSNVVTYTVTLAVDQNSVQNSHLYQGMTATVNITTAQRIGVVLIPTAALSFPSIALQNGEIDRSALFSSFGSGTRGGSAQSNKRVVLRLHNGKLTPTVITVGLNNGQYVEVVDGLQEGDQVVTAQTGGNTITPNSGRQNGGSNPFRNSGGGGLGGGRGA